MRSYKLILTATTTAKFCIEKCEQRKAKEKEIKYNNNNERVLYSDGQRRIELERSTGGNERNSTKQLTNSLERVLHSARIFIVMCSFCSLPSIFSAFSVDSKMCNTCSNRCATIKFCEYLSVHIDRDSIVFFWLKSFLEPIRLNSIQYVATAKQCKHAKKNMQTLNFKRYPSTTIQTVHFINLSKQITNWMSNIP